MNLKENAKALKILIPALFIALKKKETPTSAKILAGLTVGYALSPIDLVPDFIPAEGLWSNGKPKKWYYALPIVLIWIIFIVLLIKAFL